MVVHNHYGLSVRTDGGDLGRLAGCRVDALLHLRNAKILLDEGVAQNFACGLGVVNLSHLRQDHFSRNGPRTGKVVEHFLHHQQSLLLPKRDGASALGGTLLRCKKVRVNSKLRLDGLGGTLCDGFVRAGKGLREDAVRLRTVTFIF